MLEKGFAPAYGQRLIRFGTFGLTGEHIVSIPGTASIRHLKENISRLDWVPRKEVVEPLDALINQNIVAGRRYSDAMQKTIGTEEF